MAGSLLQQLYRDRRKILILLGLTFLLECHFLSIIVGNDCAVVCVILFFVQRYTWYVIKDAIRLCCVCVALGKV